MAKKLKLSEGGLRFHVNFVIAKMEFNSRVELVCDHYEESEKHEMIKPSWFGELSPKESDNFALLIAGYKVGDSAEILGLKAVQSE